MVLGGPGKVQSGEDQGSIRVPCFSQTMEIKVSHYTIWTRSTPELEKLALKANRERSKALKRWVLRLAHLFRVKKHTDHPARDAIVCHRLITGQTDD